ncbi:MAG: hypothetical protein J1F42_03305 [Lachnospiraceae bacterium]|nr:hypothetical protein [Lachnospiraceae bacterium]
MLEVDGYRYIGTVSIPVIGVALLVQEDWSLAQLKKLALPVRRWRRWRAERGI